MYLVIGLGLLWLNYINGLAFVVFREDRRRATAGITRICETELLLIALAGGWIVLQAGRARRNRRTLNPPVASVLNLMPVAWICALVLFGPVLGSALDPAPPAREIAMADSRADLPRQP